jgi:hypothetical protein
MTVAAKWLSCSRDIIRSGSDGREPGSFKMPQTYNVGARSVFVTAVAWFFIVLAVLTVILTVVRNAAAGSILANLPAPEGVTSVLAAYLPWVMALALALSMATLVAAVGLLLRLDWARQVFIGLLGVAIAINLAGIWLQHELVTGLVSSTLSRSPLPSSAIEVFGGFVIASRVMGTVVSLGTCLLLAWIILRLRSSAVRQEFV